MRTDFYTHPHKEQRQGLFALSEKVSAADFTDSQTISIIHQDLLLMTNELRQHALNEETFVHPLLARKIPHAEQLFYEEHVELKKELVQLENNYAHLQALAPHYEKTQTQGLAFYRSLNRFIAHYLMHIDEEEHLMPNLWEVAVEAELKSVMIAFQTNEGIELGQAWLSEHLPGMSQDEQQLFFRTSQFIAPSQVFSTMCQLTEKMMGNKRWQQIAAGL